MATLRVALAALGLALPAQSLTPASVHAELEWQQKHGNCGRGHVLPEFYVLGAMNTATTSLSKDLRARGVWAAPANGAKEWQFFSRNDEITDEDELFAKWFDSLPICTKKRLVLADFSVTNLFINKLPPDFEWSPVYGYRMRKTDQWATAHHISHFHQLAGPDTRPPKFVVMLRDPLARIHSEYYMLKTTNCHGCSARDNFVDSFAFNVELLRQEQMSGWFWKSFYARQIEEFEKEFNTSQFMFVPNREYFEIDPLRFSTELLSWLELQSRFTADPWEEASEANVHPKPQLDVELPLEHPARVAYRALMEPECRRLVRLLLRMHKRGAVLSGYSGAQGDEAAVRTWLESGW